MTPNNANVFLSSVSRTDKRFRYYGTGSIANISLLKMIYKYSCYSETYRCLQELDRKVSLLQQLDPDICINVQSGDFFPEDSPDVVIPPSNNTAPSISDGSITVTDETYESFTIADFTVNYSDPDGDAPAEVVIKTLPVNGTLSYGGIPVVINQFIPIIGNLIYTRNSSSVYQTTFTFTIFDDNQNPLQSNIATMNVGVLSSGNQAATIGDITIYSSNRVETILTLAMFTTNLTPPYNDPEGDLIDAIRVDEISTANIGIFEIDGILIEVGDIITREQLSANLLIHSAPDQDAVNSDVFNFSARDEGSQIWVQ